MYLSAEREPASSGDEEDRHGAGARRRDAHGGIRAGDARVGVEGQLVELGQALEPVLACFVPVRESGERGRERGGGRGRAHSAARLT